MNSKIHVKHILVKYEYEADDILRKIQGGESFEKMAQRFSLCPSSNEGGDLGVVNSNRLVEEFALAAEKLNPGEISMPVRTKFGYHIILKVK